MNTIKILTTLSLVLFVIATSSLLMAGFLSQKYNPKTSNITNIGAQNGGSIGAAGSGDGTQPGSSFLTMDVVAQHATTTDCYMVIDGSVYNFTPFLAAHPGGIETMKPYCGKDGTAAFATKDRNPGKKHSTMANAMLNQYYIGRLGQALATNNATNKSAGNIAVNTTANTGPKVTAVPTVSARTAANSNLSLTNAELATHNSLSNCWLLISGNVYDVTTYIVAHPGGAAAITRHCGTDATTAFATKDTGSSHSAFASNLLANYLIGQMGQTVSVAPPAAPTPPLPTATPRPATPTATVQQPPANLTLNSAEVAKHNSLADCWLIISSRIYNVTSYIVAHPGGASAITNMCGKESTSAFQTKGGKGSNHSNNAYSQLNAYLIGNLDATIQVNQTATPTPNAGGTSNPTPTTATGGGSSSGLPAAILNKYPTATKISGKYEDNNSWEGKVSVNGSCRAIKVSSSGSISQDEGC